ncbi:MULTISPECIES: DUF1801 domain-containing protein [unclassified Arthrobacter]|uniref:DUF1801 domain-containing protein n=1 Tax=unclassified Arthrobacter TaxID=235627 RepID=UPI001D134CCC|nr:MULTISPECIES: DUF1801 domain-containing protein [unclassified Arthrobacter]MCC3290880.1 DUF1801 domain-containing protein [Arthrobacter sp. zg-Y1110]MCC3301721.1 DUF1801 domain-containing protein [Arthrobacter sp. zg-Y895]UWX86295.1 DUF1801 domain-containing protein [Arthrobacter sp. zg-Y1110]
MEPTSTSVSSFIDGVASPVRRRDAQTLVQLMTRITGEAPAMWGPSIVGFGSYHYKYASGREGDAGAAAFSPRKGATTVYLPDGLDAYTEQLSRLGDHKTGAGCLYLTDLGNVDMSVLEDIIAESYRRVSADDFGSGG